MTAESRDSVLDVNNLSVTFETRNGTLDVLRDVSFSVERGRITSIVGESGCGKSVSALAILGLLPRPVGRIKSGKIRFNGRDLVGLTEPDMLAVRGNQISMIFQEPMTSLNPVFTVGDQIAETLRRHLGMDRSAALQRALELLRAVRIASPEERLRQYPFQLSGGMRQRVMIAMAIACDPELLLADEPTTALDVTVQEEIFDVLLDLRAKHSMSIVLITHDMGTVSQMADDVVVMYAGRALEKGPAADVLSNPRHPYTQALIACIPDAERDDARTRTLPEIPGVVPHLRDLGTGCPFAERCSFTMPRCRAEMPPYVAVDQAHGAACWLLAEGAC